MTRVYLIRHAKASGNAEGYFQGRIDTDLTEEGEKQLDLLSERMSEFPFDVIYSSPLKRAVRTARAANKYYNHKIILCDELCEFDGGDWEGVPIPKLCENYPELVWIFDHEPHRFQAINGESMQELAERMKLAIDKIVAENDGKTICVVSHGIAIRCYISLLQNGNLNSLADAEWCDNTSIYEIEFSDDGAKIIRFADNSHLR